MIELDRVAIRAGDFELKDVSFRVESGQYAVLMGRTGRGKTTILEAICGLRKVSSGTILVQRTNVTDWSPADREIGYVPQDLALFPNMSVADHLKFALHIRKISAREIQSRTAELAELLGLEHLLNRTIDGLSGGESQRVALGRALSFRPAVLLLDEPLSALDESTRVEMQGLLRRVQESTHVTMLHVTHNESEAAALANCRFEMVDGQVQAIAPADSV